jgi:hypothetical protein
VGESKEGRKVIETNAFLNTTRLLRHHGIAKASLKGATNVELETNNGA